MRLLTATLLLIMGLSLSAQVKPTLVSLPDVSYPILTIKKSPSSKYLFFTLTEGRFLLYDISQGKLTENSSPLWGNFSITGFKVGGDAEFSSDEKYILVTEQQPGYAHDKVKVSPFRINVLEVSSGKVVYETDGVNSAQILSDNESVLITTDEGVTTVNFKTGVQQAIKKLSGCEVACLNHAGNMLAVSYDAARDEFKQEEGAGLNKKELKNAAKNKKLISFYEYPSMKKAGIINEEIDVVFRMHYTPDDRYLVFFSRTRQAEHTHGNILNGLDNTMDLNQFQRIDMQNFKVDNLNFIYQTSEVLANFDLNASSVLFAYSDNKGFLAAKRQVVVVDFSQQQSYLGTYTYQGRARTRNLYSTAFTFSDDKTVIVANGTKLSYWNFKELPQYTEYIEPVDENAILDFAIQQLDNDIQSPESSLMKSINKKQISGLYLFNITIQKSGEVVSIFTRSDDKTNIAMQNMLKDIILKYKFDVTVPKNERIKFTYTFNL